MGTLVILALSTIAQARSERDTGKVDVRCGPYCLFVAAMALGCEPGGFDAFLSTVGPAEEAGYSMNQLAEAARGVGLNTRGVEMGIERLLDVPKPFCCIALMKDHYVLVQDLDARNGIVHIIDPPRQVKLPVDTFKLAYSGKMLILSRGPIVIGRRHGWKPAALGAGLLASVVAAILALWAMGKRARKRGLTGGAALGMALLLFLAPAGCQPAAAHRGNETPSAPRNGSPLRVEPSVVNLGKILVESHDQVAEATTELWNDGAEPIKVAAIQKSCQCTDVSLDSNTIAPGARAKLTARIKLRDLEGPNHTAVTIQCANDSIPDYAVAFSWDALTSLFTTPETWNFGRIGPADSAACRLAVNVRGLSLCPDCRLTAEPNHGLVEATPKLKTLAPGSKHEARPIKPESSSPSEIGSLKIRVLPGGEPGDYRQGVNVTLHCGTAIRSTLIVPLEWSVRTRVELTPARLWLGLCDPGQTVEREITVRSHENLPLRVAGVSCNAPALLQSSHFDAAEGVLQTVQLRFLVGTKPGLQRATLSFQLAGQTPATVSEPVSYFVKEPSGAKARVPKP